MRLYNCLVVSMKVHIVMDHMNVELKYPYIAGSVTRSHYTRDRVSETTAWLDTHPSSIGKAMVTAFTEHVEKVLSG